MAKPLTMKDLFEDENASAPDAWDISWIKGIQIPIGAVLNKAQAMQLMTETARAIDWCGEKIAFLVGITEGAKDSYKEEWAKAHMFRCQEKSLAGKKVEADADAIFLEKKSLYNKLKSYLEFFTKKQESFLQTHFAMRKIMEASNNELNVSNWETTEGAYKKTQQPEEKEPAEPDDDNFDLD